MKSKAQRRFLWATDPELARRFEDHTPRGADLPGKVTRTDEKGQDRMDAIAMMAKAAADEVLVADLAADSRITPEAVRHLAAATRLTPGEFAKRAYADPADFVACVKLVSGKTPPDRVKTADAKELLGRALAFMRDAGKATVGKGPMQGGVFGVSKATTQPGALLEKLRTGQSQAGRAATGTGLAVGTNELVPGRRFSSAPKPQPPAQPAAPAPKPQPQPPAAGPGVPGGATQDQGMSTAAKAVLGAGALGAGYLGVRAMGKKKKEVTAAEGAVEFLRYAVTKVAADRYRREKVGGFVGYLDGVAALMPAEKTAQVRRLQAEVLAGKPLSHAIKVAYPQLTGEQRGLLAAKLVRAACGTKAAEFKPFKPGVRTTERKETSFKVKGTNAGEEMKKLG